MARWWDSAPTSTAAMRLRRIEREQRSSEYLAEAMQCYAVTQSDKHGLTLEVFGGVGVVGTSRKFSALSH